MGCFADELFGGLLRSQRGSVEPPTNIAELQPHVSLKLVIAVELPRPVGVSRRITLPADLYTITHPDNTPVVMAAIVPMGSQRGK
jgi:hypothetical protein